MILYDLSTLVLHISHHSSHIIPDINNIWYYNITNLLFSIGNSIFLVLLHISYIEISDKKIQNIFKRFLWSQYRYDVVTSSRGKMSFSIICLSKTSFVSTIFVCVLYIANIPVTQYFLHYSFFSSSFFGK